ncbi:MAG: hypothetical protein RR998_08505 [Oscillospiraceae bacterium]
MDKSDKELAVELASAYVSAWYSKERNGNQPMQCMSSNELSAILKDAYRAVKALDNC